MYKLFDYRCLDCKHVFEELVTSPEPTQRCPACGGVGYRQISVPKFSLDGTNPDFPGAYDKWAKDREKRLAQERKRAASTGDPLPSVTDI